MPYFLDDLRKVTVSPLELEEKEEAKKNAMYSAKVLSQADILTRDIKNDMNTKAKHGKYADLGNGKKKIIGECTITEVRPETFESCTTSSLCHTWDYDTGIRSYNDRSDFPAAELSKISTTKGRGWFRATSESFSEYKLFLYPIIYDVYEEVKSLLDDEGIKCELLTELHFWCPKSKQSKNKYYEIKGDTYFFSENWDEKLSIASIKIRATAIY